MIRLKKPSLFIVIVWLGICLNQLANAQDSNANLPDSPSHAAENREVTWGSLPGDFLRDQKAIWLGFPSQLAHGRHWVPTLAIVAGTAGLILPPPPETPYFCSPASH